jgi:hypothetical protein
MLTDNFDYFYAWFFAVNHLDYLGVQVAWVTGPWFLSIFMNMLPWESGKSYFSLFERVISERFYGRSRRKPWVFWLVVYIPTFIHISINFSISETILFKVMKS